MIAPKQTLISSPRVDVSLLSNRRRREKQREMWIIELRLFVPPVAMQILMEHVRFLFFSSNSYTRFLSLTIHQSSLPVPPVVSETHHITQVLPSSQTLSLSLLNSPFFCLTSSRLFAPPAPPRSVAPPASPGAAARCSQPECVYRSRCTSNPGIQQTYARLICPSRCGVALWGIIKSL